jgi:hypothetical protein
VANQGSSEDVVVVGMVGGAMGRQKGPEKEGSLENLLVKVPGVFS